MKRILTLILVMASLAIQSVAQDSKTDTSSQRVKLEISQYNETSGRHRAPMRVDIEVWYNAESNAIDISYDGEAAGEVFIYHNGNIIGYDSAINTSIPLPTATGLYDIEICGEHWGAYGTLQL